MFNDEFYGVAGGRARTNIQAQKCFYYSKKTYNYNYLFLLYLNKKAFFFFLLNKDIFQYWAMHNRF